MWGKNRRRTGSGGGSFASSGRRYLTDMSLAVGEAGLVTRRPDKPPRTVRVRARARVIAMATVTATAANARIRIAITSIAVPSGLPIVGDPPDPDAESVVPPMADNAATAPSTNTAANVVAPAAIWACRPSRLGPRCGPVVWPFRDHAVCNADVARARSGFAIAVGEIGRAG